MKLIYLKSTWKSDSFDVYFSIKIPFFRVWFTIEPGRSLLQFVTTNCLKKRRKKCDWFCFIFRSAKKNRFDSIHYMKYPQLIIRNLKKRKRGKKSHPGYSSMDKYRWIKEIKEEEYKTCIRKGFVNSQVNCTKPSVVVLGFSAAGI